jgi:flagellar hook protein FlgE
MTLYFNKTAANTWDVNTYVDGALANGAGISTLTFDTDGTLLSATNAAKSAALTNGAATLGIDLDYNSMTQFGSAFGVNTLDQDGFASGQLSGFSVGDDGVILGRYTNGRSQMLGQIALANFTNSQGLRPLGDSRWGETPGSGAPLVGAPGTAGLGAVQSSALEDANIDLTAELVNMITAQRIYQANAQSIKTQDQVLQTLVNLK